MKRDPYRVRWRAWWLPWWAMRLLDRYLNVCWCKLVMLKMAGLEEGLESLRGLWVDGHCWDGPEGREYDYCNKYASADDIARAQREWFTWPGVRK